MLAFGNGVNLNYYKLRKSNYFGLTEEWTNPTEETRLW